MPEVLCNILEPLDTCAGCGIVPRRNALGLMPVNRPERLALPKFEGRQQQPTMPDHQVEQALTEVAGSAK